MDYVHDKMPGPETDLDKIFLRDVQKLGLVYEMSRFVSGWLLSVSKAMPDEQAKQLG